MFPISLIRHESPELFFAIVAPVGANVEGVRDGLAEALKGFKYKLEPIRVIEQLKQFDTYLTNEAEFEYEKIKHRMDEGDRFRTEMERDDALALLALSAVIKFRAKHPEAKTIPRQAYLFRSLKRPEEVTALRRIYGSNLILIGIHCARERRVDNLAERLAAVGKPAEERPQGHLRRHRLVHQSRFLLGEDATKGFARMRSDG